MSGTKSGADGPAAKEGPAHQATVQEVQGIFPGDDAMQVALGELSLAGYDRADFSLPEEQPTTATETPNESASAPTDDLDKQQLRMMGTSMAGYAGAVAVAGATIATGGAVALAVAAAAVVGASSAAVAGAAGLVADKAQAGERDRRGAAGTLVLAVRTRSPEQADQVMELMRRAGASAVEPVTRVDQSMTAGVTSASWTG